MLWFVKKGKRKEEVKSMMISWQEEVHPIFFT